MAVEQKISRKTNLVVGMSHPSVNCCSHVLSTEYPYNLAMERKMKKFKPNAPKEVLVKLIQGIQNFQLIESKVMMQCLNLLTRGMPDRNSKAKYKLLH